MVRRDSILGQCGLMVAIGSGYNGAKDDQVIYRWWTTRAIKGRVFRFKESSPAITMMEALVHRTMVP